MILQFRNTVDAIRAGVRPFYTEQWDRAPEVRCPVKACTSDVYVMPDAHAECGELHICAACGFMFSYQDRGYATEGHDLERLQKLHEQTGIQ